MITSMTGYGQATTTNERFKVTVEMKSYNHRFCEMMIRLPRQYYSVEDDLKKMIGQHVQRGKVDVYITIEGEGLIKRTLSVDWDLVKQYLATSKQMQKVCETDEGLSIQSLLLHEDIVSICEQEQDTRQIAQVLLETTEQAVLQLKTMRNREGESLMIDLEERVATINTIVRDLFEHAPKVTSAYRERLLKRVADFLDGNAEIDENRMVNEVAIFSDKANIEEELTRLSAHTKQFIAIMKTGGVVGRKLDFLVQEMNREANTIGSKANDIHISQQVVELKSEIEKVKEQVQNVE
ncbi:YicC family protein [Desertibacillus haloalkaliphilus]|nr:YicC family protein [Desertibacillus haloalkaliphilus]